mmetsp:Transcript_24404/g.68429  ORF Transcript_24404/g.68429 Transcript_24404/m.68429 type:complete len:300 (+) Transcript_24404:154-1053(+)|eukprot:CAMPEP_0119119596 /NCGR_PEP_ID=MMETSP1310-20130426/1014_1 /TAXON_ID=464262 /ORGANISM="Genus nov. species nov., Strain RCC2339" /LENGTH=299 /DNA_ID=CAMNT_0007109041 /DNA_START=141 /DNA_END=1040 /DNA_ORIENTATION=+
MAEGFLSMIGEEEPPLQAAPPPTANSMQNSGSPRCHDLEKEIGELTLSTIVKDPLLCQLFEKFSDQEFAGENFKFWLAAESYKVIDNDAMRKEALENIYTKYFHPNTDTEVNLSGEERLAVESARKLAAPPREVFDDVQISVWINLSTELLPRFLRSDLLYRFFSDRPDSPSTEISRRKLEDFFGMCIEGPLKRVEIIKVVRTRGFKKNNNVKGGGGLFGKKKEKPSSVPARRLRMSFSETRFGVKPVQSTPEFRRYPSTAYEDVNVPHRLDSPLRRMKVDTYSNSRLHVADVFDSPPS